MNLSEAKALAERLMIEHGAGHYTLHFDDSRRRFGVCRRYERTITLSKPLTELNEQKHVEDVILHEIAHAISPEGGHGRKWRQVALSIGCNGQRCYGSDVITPSKPWRGTCSEACGNVFDRFRRIDGRCKKCKQDISWKKNK